MEFIPNEKDRTILILQSNLQNLLKQQAPQEDEHTQVAADEEVFQVPLVEKDDQIAMLESTAI